MPRLEPQRVRHQCVNAATCAVDIPNAHAGRHPRAVSAGIAAAAPCHGDETCVEADESGSGG
jgi:hypothetical protein